MSQELKNIIEIIRDCSQEIEKEYHVGKIGIFGSIVRGEEKNDSDVDILVEFTDAGPIGLFKFVELEEYLTKLLGRKVDLGMFSSLKPRIKQSVLNQVVYV